MSETLRAVVNIYMSVREHNTNYYVRSEVFTTVTMKNAVFWDVAPCRSCAN
jgi:hypothetical protein